MRGNSSIVHFMNQRESNTSEYRRESKNSKQFYPIYSRLVNETPWHIDPQWACTITSKRYKMLVYKSETNSL